ncbi:MAG: hypothetical protein GC201_03745 [Alphaproteobacteria bacterium]|nr:hypothetical protein [Alphaproteobacteria bacterium]
MSTVVEDWELGALIDGTLPPGRTDEIQRALANAPALRARLEAFEADQAALEGVGDALAVSGPLPPAIDALSARLERSLARPSRWPRLSGPVPQVARYAAVLVVGAALGWGAAASQDQAAVPETALALVDEATEIHQTAALAPGFAREASSATIGLLDSLFARDLEPPDLSEWGFHVARVDVVATDDGPAAVFAYTDADAHLVTLVMSMSAGMIASLRGEADTPRVTTHDGLAVSYGQVPGLAFAIVGTVTEARILAIARRVEVALSA